MCETIIHPEFNDKTRENDIAILRLCDYIAFNERTKLAPACLPSIADNNYENIMVRIAAYLVLMNIDRACCSGYGVQMGK